MICLNSVIDLMRLSSTIRRHVWASTPVLIKLRGAGNHRVGRLGVDEVVELGLALVVVARDPHDVPAVGGCEIGVGVDHGLAHALSVVDVLAEDDRLGETVGGHQEFGDLGGDNSGSFLEDKFRS